MCSVRYLDGADNHRRKSYEDHSYGERLPEKPARMSDVSGGIFSSISEAIERSRSLIDRGHQMRRDVHQVYRYPFGREPARRWAIGTGERLLIDRTLIVVFLPFSRWDAM